MKKYPVVWPPSPSPSTVRKATCLSFFLSFYLSCLEASVPFTGEFKRSLVPLVEKEGSAAHKSLTWNANGLVAGICKTRSGTLHKILRLGNKERKLLWSEAKWPVPNGGLAGLFKAVSHVKIF